jgi:3'-phosphoadenosine 5'-phosphosulfate sulfotransferase (PAPS reductase)/FAD synthetase
MIPDLSSFDYIAVSTSAGKDSQAMLDLVVEAATAAGVRDRVLAIHADLGPAEWEGTGALAAEHAAHYGVPLVTVRRDQDLLAQVTVRGMWPSPKQRYCTSDHKRDQIQKHYTQLAAQARRRLVRILECVGLRAQESSGRAKRPALARNDRASNSRREVVTWLPIHAWTVEDVWARIRQAGTRPHPAYLLGMPRLSCVFCIFAGEAALLLAGYHNRKLLDVYVAVEEKTGHTFKQGLSLRAIRDKLDTGYFPPPATDWRM